MSGTCEDCAHSWAEHHAAYGCTHGSARGDVWDGCACLRSRPAGEAG